MTPSVLQETIVKVKGGYRIISHRTGKNLGTYKSRAEAQAALRRMARFREGRILREFNPYHAPAGSSEGGQFTTAPGGSGGGKTATRKGRSEEERAAHANWRPVGGGKVGGYRGYLEIHGNGQATYTAETNHKGTLRQFTHKSSVGGKTLQHLSATMPRGLYRARDRSVDGRMVITPTAPVTNIVAEIAKLEQLAAEKPWSDHGAGSPGVAGHQQRYQAAENAAAIRKDQTGKLGAYLRTLKASGLAEAQDRIGACRYMTVGSRRICVTGGHNHTGRLREGERRTLYFGGAQPGRMRKKREQHGHT